VQPGPPDDQGVDDLRVDHGSSCRYCAQGGEQLVQVTDAVFEQVRQP
jgi:hypothetical protein